MADSSLITNIKPETITAFGNLITVIAGIIGTAITGLGIIIRKNTQVTTKNTTANVETKKALAEAVITPTDADTIRALRDEIVSTVEAFNATIDKARIDLAREVRNIKIVVAKVNIAADEKLGMIPKVQDALKKHDELIKHESERTREILDIITSAKGSKK